MVCTLKDKHKPAVEAKSHYSKTGRHRTRKLGHGHRVMHSSRTCNGALCICPEVCVRACAYQLLRFSTGGHLSASEPLNFNLIVCSLAANLKPFVAVTTHAKG